LSERFSPRLTDWVTGKVAFVGQKTDEENSGLHEGSLFEPVSGLDTIEGRFSDEQLTSDPYTYVQTRPNLKAGLLAGTAILGGLLIWRATKSNR
jgi:hypothetical protein